MAINALQVLASSFGLLNVFLPGEAIPNAEAQDGLRRLNAMLGSWAQQTGTVPVNARLVFPTVANVGSYTIGPGGNFNVPRPANALSVTGAGLLWSTPTPNVELVRAVIDDSMYAAIAVKDLKASIWTYVYYDPVYPGGLGEITLWPAPDNATNSLVLYVDQAITAFADLTTAYDFPPGYEEALIYNLARRLGTPTGRTLDADALQIAAQSLRVIKRANVRLTDLGNDFACAGGFYNIQTGDNG